MKTDDRVTHARYILKLLPVVPLVVVVAFQNKTIYSTNTEIHRETIVFPYICEN